MVSQPPFVLGPGTSTALTCYKKLFWCSFFFVWHAYGRRHPLPPTCRIFGRYPPTHLPQVELFRCWLMFLALRAVPCVVCGSTKRTTAGGRTINLFSITTIFSLVCTINSVIPRTGWRGALWLKASDTRCPRQRKTKTTFEGPNRHRYVETSKDQYLVLREMIIYCCGHGRHKSYNKNRRGMQ